MSPLREPANLDGGYAPGNLSSSAVRPRRLRLTRRVNIRPEIPADQPRIYEIVTAAFEGQPYADGDEQDLVDNLRGAGALTISLVADLDGDIVGHIAFSPARASAPEQSWYALGPVAVRPDLQRRGIGAELIERGLELLVCRGADGCILTGDPGYYQRFGFALSAEHTPERESTSHFMTQSLSNAVPPPGPIQFHPTFYDPCD